jgi:hypothetical protein
MVFLSVMLSSMTDRYWCFGEIYSLHCQLKFIFQDGDSRFLLNLYTYLPTYQEACNLDTTIKISDIIKWNILCTTWKCPYIFHVPSFFVNLAAVFLAGKFVQYEYITFNLLSKWISGNTLYRSFWYPLSSHLLSKI